MFQCPEDATIFQNVCYYVIDAQMNKAAGTATCQIAGGWLAYPRSTAEYEFIFSVAKATGLRSQYFWLGGEKIDGV